MTPSSDENDQTVMMPATAIDKKNVTTASVHNESEPDEDAHVLQAGTMLGEFELKGKLGEGGFSVVYLAWDHSLDRKVALKEYMPSSIALRKGGLTVSVRSSRDRDTYEAGLRSFINEGKLLAQFDHPSLVKVYRFWEANGTAYMVMPLYEGITLKEAILRERIKVDEVWLRSMLGSLCDALSVIHAENCYHRDIAPDNIILLEGTGKPLLLDFGAARRVIGDMTQALTVILKPGYAPIEQYAELPDMRQGPWTDIYALAATVHWVIARTTPPPSVGRLLNDSYNPLVKRLEGQFSEALLRAVDRALAAHPDARTPSIAAFRSDLEQAPNTILPPPDKSALQKPAPVAKTKAAPKAPHSQTAATGPENTHTSPSRNAVYLLAGMSVAAVLSATAWWFMRGTGTEHTPPPAVATTTPPATPAAPAVSTSPAPPIPSPPQTLSEALARFVAARDPKVQVALRADDTPASAGIPTRVTLESSAPGYLYLMAQHEKDEALYLVLPEGSSVPQKMDPGKTPIPSAALAELATVAAGQWRLVAVMADEPAQINTAGWIKQGQHHALKSVQALTQNGAALDLLGSMTCSSNTSACAARYGTAELMTIIRPVQKTTESKNTTETPAPPVQAPIASTPAPSAKKSGKAAPGANAAECAAIFQQISLGDSNPELTGRLEKLHCR